MLEIHGQPLFQGAVEDRIARGVYEVGDQDRVLLGERRGAVEIEERSNCHGDEDDRRTRQHHPLARGCLGRRCGLNRSRDCGDGLRGQSRNGAGAWRGRGRERQRPRRRCSAAL